MAAAGVTAENWCTWDMEFRWADQCNSEDEDVLWWQWTCGWYLAQTELGNIPIAPWWCATQMPAGCFIDFTYGVFGLDYFGNANEAGNADENLFCNSNYAFMTFYGIVFALSPDQATEQCQSIDPTYVAIPLESYDYNLGPDGYMCVIP